MVSVGFQKEERCGVGPPIIDAAVSRTDGGSYEYEEEHVGAGEEEEEGVGDEPVGSVSQPLHLHHHAETTLFLVDYGRKNDLKEGGNHQTHNGNRYIWGRRDQGTGLARPTA